MVEVILFMATVSSVAREQCRRGKNLGIGPKTASGYYYDGGDI